MMTVIPHMEVVFFPGYYLAAVLAVGVPPGVLVVALAVSAAVVSAAAELEEAGD